MYGVLLLLVNVESECKWTLIEKLKYTKHFLIDYNKIIDNSNELVDDFKREDKLVIFNRL